MQWVMHAQLFTSQFQCLSAEFHLVLAGQRSVCLLERDELIHNLLHLPIDI